jgi:hypothetical protein
LDQHLLISLSLQGLSKFDREPLLVGVSVGSLEKAFSVVDTGPTAENKDEVLQVFLIFFFGGGGGGGVFHGSSDGLY